MITTNRGKVALRFNTEDQGKIKLSNGLELIRPDAWNMQDDDGTNGGTKMAIQTDKRITNPQTATVVYVAVDSELKPGDKVFTHFLAYDADVWFEDDIALVEEELVLFKIVGNKIVPFNGNIFGFQIFKEPERTEHGIYTTSATKVKELCHIQITHVPKGNYKIERDGEVFAEREFRFPFKVGDEVVTIDDKQFKLVFNGAEYIKLVADEIVGIVDSGSTSGLKPISL